MSLLNDPAFLDGAAGSVNRAVLTFVGSNPVAQISCSGEIQVIYLDAEGQTITDTYTNLSKRSIQVPTPAGSPVYIIGNVTLLSVASKLSAIDLRSCRSLTTLTLSGQTEITGVNIAGCKQLVYLDLSGCTKLAGIDLTENTALVSLNLANCVALASLSLEENVLLESVDITNCSALPYLDATMLTVLSSLKYEGTMLQSPNNSLILIAAHYGTDLAAARAAAEEAAASVKKVERLLEQLPDGQAVTATVALHTEEIAKLKESSMTRVELVCEDDTKITLKGSSTALTYAQIKALVDDTTKFVTLQYMGLWWMLPSYDDGGAIMFTATDIQNGHPQVTRVIINTAGQLNNYTIVAEDADHKTNDLSVEVAADGDLTYPTTRAVNGKLIKIDQEICSFDLQINGFTDVTPSQPSGLIWDGSSVVRSSSFDGYIIATMAGKKYTFVNSTIYSCIAFKQFPYAGLSGGKSRSVSSFIAEEGYFYVLVTCKKDSSFKCIASIENSIFSELEGIKSSVRELDSYNNDFKIQVYNSRIYGNKYSGLAFLGGTTISAAVGSYDGLLLYLKRGVNVIAIGGVIVNNESIVTVAQSFNNKPTVGSSIKGVLTKKVVGTELFLKTSNNDNGIWVNITLNKSNVLIDDIYYRTDSECEEKIDNLYQELHAKNPLYNKKIVNFGDSIFGNKRDSSHGIDDSISTLISEQSGSICYNAGFGGCRMSENPSQAWNAFSMHSLADSIASGDWSLQQTAIDNYRPIFEQAGVYYFQETLNMLKSMDWSVIDYITIAYGTNDYMANVAISGTENTTYEGALRYSIDKILSSYPNIKIIVLSPIWRGFLNGETLEYDSDDERSRNGVGKMLIDYVDACIAVSNEKHVSIIDMYRNLGFNSYTWQMYFVNDYGVEGTHPVEKGCKRMADRIVAQIKTMFT